MMMMSFIVLSETKSKLPLQNTISASSEQEQNETSSR
jgi:hypothetical protein